MLVVALVAALGTGCPATDPARALRTGRRHFERAEVHFRLGAFEEAIDAYARAYRSAPLPGLLFNIAQCFRHLGDYERAIFFYGRYLRDAPRARNRALVISLIAESRARLADGDCGPGRNRMAGPAAL